MFFIHELDHRIRNTFVDTRSMKVLEDSKELKKLFVFRIYWMDVMMFALRKGREELQKEIKFGQRDSDRRSQ